MSISSQLPPVVVAARSGALQALALQAGQVVDARIIGPAANGQTQVEIRGQMLNLKLPVTVTPGQTLRLDVQAVGAQIRLAVSQTPIFTPVDAKPPVSVSISQAPANPAAAPSRTSGYPAQVQAQVSTPSSAGQVASRLPTAPAPVAGSLPTPPNSSPVPPSLPNISQTSANPVPTPTSAAGLGTSVAAQPAQGAAVAGLASSINRPPAPPPPPPTGGIQPVMVRAPAGGLTNPYAGSAQTGSPQGILAQMANASLQTQVPVSHLTAALTNVAGRVVLPEAVTKAAQLVLGARVSIDGKFDGAALQIAVKNSGVFQESTLAAGKPLLPGGGDMKSALLALKQTLVSWLGQQAPVAQVAQVPPPLKGVLPRAKPVEPPPLDAEDLPEHVGKQLLERTEGALARVRLHQHASLPDPMVKAADWSLELPVLIGNQQSLMHLHIHRDEHHDEEPLSERGWQMQFALSVPGIGEVGAQVSLRAGTTGVMLWAGEPDVAVMLEADLDILREALGAAGLTTRALFVRPGVPADVPLRTSGHALDAVT
jgi:hypothetical protein